MEKKKINDRDRTKKFTAALIISLKILCMDCFFVEVGETNTSIINIVIHCFLPWCQIL